MNHIQIIYNDGMFGFVEPAELCHLINEREIVKFLREDAWVYLGVDQTRTRTSFPLLDGKRRTDPQRAVS